MINSSFRWNLAPSSSRHAYMSAPSGDRDRSNVHQRGESVLRLSHPHQRRTFSGSVNARQTVSHDASASKIERLSASTWVSVTPPPPSRKRFPRTARTSIVPGAGDFEIAEDVAQDDMRKPRGSTLASSNSPKASLNVAINADGSVRSPTSEGMASFRKGCHGCPTGSSERAVPLREAPPSGAFRSASSTRLPSA